MADKPRIRRPAGSSRITQMTGDSFQNFAADMGVGANNLLSQSTYGFNPIGRYHTKLEWMYRGSWLVRKVVDCPADDMTRAGIDFSSDLPPDDVDAMHAEWTRLGLWNKIREGIKWGRLYGGCIAVIMIEGQDMAQPLRLNTIAKGAFKGLLVLDRWMINPALSEFVEDFGPEFGMPKYYDTITDGSVPKMHIHHSRVVRFEGDAVPYWQRIAENGWTVSVIEQLYDRMIAFDSASTGAAQLVYKAHLRTYKVPGLRELIASGGVMYQAFLDNMAMIRSMQTNEGLTLIDGDDAIEYHSNGAFSGLSDAMVSFGQQLSGAAGIPLVILFGQSPTGLNSTGESDVRNYYDRISSRQKMDLNSPVDKIARVQYWSQFGRPPPDEFGFTFNPLWQLTEEQRANNASTISTAVKGAFDSGIIDQPTALAELKQSSHETGVFSNITEEQIEQAKLMPPPPPDMGGAGGPPGQMGHNGGPPLDGPPGAAGAPPAAMPPAGPPTAPGGTVNGAQQPAAQPGTPALGQPADPDGFIPAQPEPKVGAVPPGPGMFRLGGTPENIKVNVAEGLRVRVNYNMGDSWQVGGQQWTVDDAFAGKFDESKHKRDAGGKFSHQESHNNAIAKAAGFHPDDIEHTTHGGEVHKVDFDKAVDAHHGKLTEAGFKPFGELQKNQSQSHYQSSQHYTHPEGHNATLKYTHSWGREHNTKETHTQLNMSKAPPPKEPEAPKEDPKAKAKADLAAHNAKLAAEWDAHEQWANEAAANAIADLKAIQAKAAPPAAAKPAGKPDIEAAKAVAESVKPHPVYKNVEKQLEMHPVGQKYVGNKLKKIDELLAGPDPITALKALEVSPTFKKVDTYKLALIAALEKEQGGQGAAKPAEPFKPMPAYQPKESKAPPVPGAGKLLRAKLADGSTLTIKNHADPSKVPSDYQAKLNAAKAKGKHVDTARETFAEKHYLQQSHDQQAAITSYQGGGYRAMNKQLAGLPLDKTYGQENPEEVQQRIDLLKSSIAQSFLPEAMELQRGIKVGLKGVTGFDDEQQAVGGVFLHKGFASASRSANIAAGFGSAEHHVIMKFSVPAGTKALMMRGQVAHGQGGATTIREKEIVMPSNSLFRIDKVESHGSHGHLVHCTYLGEKHG